MFCNVICLFLLVILVNISCKSKIKVNVIVGSCGVLMGVFMVFSGDLLCCVNNFGFW